MNTEESLILKRERFRVQLRKEQLDKEFGKKRIIIPNQEQELLNEKLQKVRNQMIAITENMENDFVNAMNKYYNYLIEQELMNEILEEFRTNYNPDGRIQIYWILSNLTLGDGISAKLIFDTTFDFLSIIYQDLQYIEYVFFGLEIIQNFLADRDIDVVEALLTSDLLLKALNENKQFIPPEKYSQIMTHICTIIVQFKLFLSQYTVDTICQELPSAVAFQWVYILAKGMEAQNEQLILNTLKYFMQNDDNYNFMLVKILEQVTEQELEAQIFKNKEIKQSIAQLFLQTKNPDILNSILFSYHNASQDDDLAELICQSEVIDKAVELSLEYKTCVNALKFLDTWMIDPEFLFDFPTLIDENYYCQQICNLNQEFPAESIQILKYIKSILQYGDSRNDDSYRQFLCQQKAYLEKLVYSQNQVLEKLAEQVLQCYAID